MSCELIKLVVGSAADWTLAKRTDIDLLVSLNKPMKRVDFAFNAESYLQNLKDVYVEKRLGGTTPFAYVKYFVNTTNGNVVDITFTDPDSWTNEEVLAFHRNFDLAFCVL